MPKTETLQEFLNHMRLTRLGPEITVAHRTISSDGRP